MKVKKKSISWLKRCFIVSAILSIVWLLPLQGSCASSLNYPLTMDNSVSSSWNTLSDYMKNSDRWGKFQPVSATTSFLCFYQLNDDSHVFIPTFVADCSYTLSVNYALTIPTTSYNTVNSNSFSSKAYLTVILQNGTSVHIYPTVNFTKWNDGTGWTVRNTFDIPEGAKSVYTITFGFNFNSSFPTSQSLYLTVYPFQLKTVSGTDKIIEQFGSNYSQPDTNNQDNYNKAESQLMGGVQSTLNGVNSQWNNLNGDLLQYQGAFLAFNRFFNNLTGIPWLGTVITLSVSIGVFALLLGAVLDYAKGTQRTTEREAWKAETRRYRGKMLAESQKRRKGK